jgi:hypothetical protein
MKNNVFFQIHNKWKEGADKCREWADKWGILVQVIGIIVGLPIALGSLYVGLYIPIHDVGTIVSSTEQAVKRLTEANQFRINYPANGGVVDSTDIVRGITPYPNRNHYIVVTPIKGGGDWVQEGPMKISTGNVWIGRAIFGAAAVGAGEGFVIRAIATNSTLSPGTLIEVPEDAIFSESVVVTRKKTNESS